MQGNWGSEGKHRREAVLLLRRRWKGGFTRLYRCNTAGIDQLLRIAGEIHTNVTQALLAAAGVINLFGVDADRFAEAACIVAVIAANRTRAANFFSHVYYLQTKIEATSVSIYSEIFRGVTAKKSLCSELQRDFCQRGMGAALYVHPDASGLMAVHTGLDKANAEHAVLYGREGVGRILTTCLAVGEHITERTVNIRERLDKAFVMACTDAGKPRAGIEQIVCTGGQPLTRLVSGR